MDIADQLVAELGRNACRVVFAESCTGGMVACELAKVPGVSQWLCGSVVTYRSDSKIRWLGVRAEDIEQFTDVSDPVARQMAQGVLQRTPEASLSASVTGHFGPGAPEGFDGIVFVGIAARSADGQVTVDATRHQLASHDRAARQIEATELVMRTALRQLRGPAEL